MAFRRGDDSQEARAGAVLVADGLRCLRTLEAFVLALGKGK